MYSKEDTICAISTPPGKGAIAVVRCSGDKAFDICDKIIRLHGNEQSLIRLPANTMHYSTVYDGEDIVDQVVTGIFRKPHSYSGEDTVEISCHGSPFIQKKILELLVKSGARLATAGEFTMRAFFNGKLDLTQVEAVADLISSGSEAAHRVAISQMRGGFTREIKKLRDKLLNFISLVELELDFSEEDVEFADRAKLKALIAGITTTLNSLSASFRLGNVIKQGIPVAIVGKTNAGKSTLLNLLLREEKAIVSDIEGTTRDSIEDVISIKGIHFRLIDTAGLRHTEDTIERMGIERTWQKVDQALVIIQVLDTKSKADELKSMDDKIHLSAGSKKRIVVLNKIDKVSEEKLNTQLSELNSLLSAEGKVIPISASQGTNLSQLEEALVSTAGIMESDDNNVIITNVRHYEALEKALSAMKRAGEGMENNVPGDLLAQDIRETLHYLGEITGEITTEEVLGNIFKNFCIGK